MKKTIWFALGVMLFTLVLLMVSSCELAPEDPPEPPGGLKAYADSQTEIRISWNKSTFATEYLLYRSTSKNSDYSQIAAVSSPYYSDKGLSPEKIYYYKIAARNDTGESSISAAVQCKTPSYNDTPFWASNINTNGFYRTWTQKVYIGTHCEIYAEIPGYTSHAREVSLALAKSIGDEYDANIYPKITGTFGTPIDVDGNNKVTLLLLDIQDGYDGSPYSPYTAGFFFSIDMEQGYEYSNKKDMLYIDTWPSWASSSPTLPNNITQKEKAQSCSTIAHELQHLINYSLHIGAGKGSEMDVWIDEGLASAAEYIYGGKQQDRIDYFKQDPRGTILRGNNFFVWNDDWNDTLANYATVYLFFQWLRIHANGTGIYSDIIKSNNPDYRSVTNAANSRIDSKFLDWEVLLRTWLAANFLGKSSGYEGYKWELNWDDLKTSALSTAGSNHQWTLAPGEGVYSQLPSNTFTAPTGSVYGSHIKYAALNDTTQVVTPQPNGNLGNISDDIYLLTFNANTKATNINQGDFETGYITNVKLPDWSPRAFIKRNAAGRSILPSGEEYIPPQPYEWDGARYFFDKDKPKPPSRNQD